MSNIDVELKAVDIDAQLEQMVGKVMEGQQDLGLLSQTEPFDRMARNSKFIKDEQDRLERDQKIMMNKAKSFAQTNLQAGDGRNAKAPSRISNRITSRVG